MRVWRIVKDKWAATAFDGKGAQLYPGRWNSSGRAVVYTASSPSHACLEIVVTATQAGLLNQFVAIPAEVPDECIAELGEDRWPAEWQNPVIPASTRAICDEWLAGATSAALTVPSAVSIERNVLLNPAHPEFSRIVIGKPLRFPLDPRLVKEAR